MNGVTQDVLAQPWQDFLTKRVLLVTGKGGVGRTTITAALARAAAQAGRRVLIAEIGEPDGDYSPLARLFGREMLPPQVVHLEPNVKGCLLFSRVGHTIFLETVLPISTLVRAAMRSKALNKLLDAAPSFNEMGVFNHLLSLIKETRRDGRPEHELIIVDMPATGHTLALTALPDVLLRLMPTGPIAELLKEGQRYLYDAEFSAATIVTLPETLPVTECLELVDGLRKTRVHVGTILVNKVVADPFDDDERAFLNAQIEGQPFFGKTRFLTMAQIERSIERLQRYAGAPVMALPEFPHTGDELVSALAKTLHSHAPR